MSIGRRKTKRTYNEPGHAHYLTYSCFDRLPLLSAARTCEWVLESIGTAKARHEMDVYAYVIMPEHVHLLVRSRRAEYRLDRFLADLKRPVSWKAKQFLIRQDRRDWLRRLTIEEGGRKTFRFWLPGGGYDENAWSVRTVRAMAEYTHFNPVRRGLVKKPTDWPWSSARFWAGMPGVLMPMDPIPT
jgi:putative transposase